jgi:hypothetical protein
MRDRYRSNGADQEFHRGDEQIFSFDVLNGVDIYGIYHLNKRLISYEIALWQSQAPVRRAEHDLSPRSAIGRREPA